MFATIRSSRLLGIGSISFGTALLIGSILSSGTLPWSGIAAAGAGAAAAL